MNQYLELKLKTVVQFLSKELKPEFAFQLSKKEHVLILLLVQVQCDQDSSQI